MSVAEAETWAATLTAEGMQRKLRELEIWVAEVNGAVVGWPPFMAIGWRDYIPTRNSLAEVSVQNYLACSKR